LGHGFGLARHKDECYLNLAKSILRFDSYIMFNLFKKESELDKLKKQYEKLLKQSYELSTTDRKASDLKRAEAEAIAQKIDELNKANQA
jgi:hypothetical protein